MDGILRVLCRFSLHVRKDSGVLVFKGCPEFLTKRTVPVHHKKSKFDLPKSFFKSKSIRCAIACSCEMRSTELINKSVWETRSLTPLPPLLALGPSLSTPTPTPTSSSRTHKIYSGAMDKFTAKGNGTAAAGGVTAKRTKTVLKSRTYFEGGYMKSVCEEVEVTDDEEVRRCVSADETSSLGCMFRPFHSADESRGWP